MNYPNGIKKEKTTKDITYKNRGMSLENEINSANEYYRSIDKAYIYKKPTPIKIVKTDYPSRDKAVIKEAYFTIPSTTDYNGIYKGYYVDFEAKETKNKTSFSLNNIHSHQIKHLENIYRHKGIAFIIVRFTTINKTYLLLINDLIEFINNTDRKSIPIDFFEKKAYIIRDSLKPTIDYLKILDKVMEGNNGKEEK
jgi:recombination protein U